MTMSAAQGSSGSRLVRYKRTAKGLLRRVEQLLPENSSNDALYRNLHLGYRHAARALYQGKVVWTGLIRAEDEHDVSRRVLAASEYSLVGFKGLEATYRLGLELNRRGVQGNFVELGVARGGCAALLGQAAFAARAGERHLWLFDSFEGLPDPTQEDFREGETGDHVRPLPKGSCLGTLEEVKHNLLEVFELPSDRIHFVKGWFQDTLGPNKDRVGKIALLRLDGDWYESTKVCLEHLYDSVVDGGVIVVDDYESCHGCKRAVDEFLAARGLQCEITLDGRGGGFFWK